MSDRAFEIHYAKVLLREARARRGSVFAAQLVEWAGKARRRARDMKTEQGELF